MWIERILQLDNLRLAWEEVAEKQGAPGLDQVSIARWRRNWEERLVELARSVRANTYRPRKPRIFTIPKRDGSSRRISILTVSDRVLQRAVLRVVDDVFDRGFLDCSFGYRLGRGVRSAIPVILAHRAAGRQWVLDADVDDCFGSLDHGLIVERFGQVIDDPLVLRLLRQWLAAGRTSEKSDVGIPLGAVISPLLCNIVLHRLDQDLVQGGFAPVRYADDFCVFCGNQAEAQAALEQTNAALASLKLRLEPAKTGITTFERGFDFLGVHFEDDSYSFTCQKKRIQVRGEFDAHLFYDYVPDGYEG
jgi:group II intron reverse transcriptase/maturase